MNKCSRVIFDSLKALLPDLPPHITKLTVTLDVDGPPIIECRYLVRGPGCLVEENETMEIVSDEEVNPG